MSPQCTFEDQCDRQTTPYIHPVHHVHRPRQPEPTVRHCIVHNPDKERRYRQKDTGDVRPIRMVEEGIFEICPVEDCTASHTDDVDEKDNEVDHEEDGTDLALAVERKLDAAYEDGDGSCTHVDCEAADTVVFFFSQHWILPSKRSPGWAVTERGEGTYGLLPSPEFTSGYPSPRLVVRIIDLLCIKVMTFTFFKCGMIMMMFVGMRSL